MPLVMRFKNVDFLLDYIIIEEGYHHQLKGSMKEPKISYIFLF